ncbi:thioredoxin family protein [Daejeonella lutea]|uniref:Thioredoxin-like n=1 Tax=Daejeonella lutea TaxID=572036 RepID=A0A1T5BNR1_9SPHI|nr:thioredoxin family protein [Daejeonella lutea]SKB48757.1 Thioredoxin-like [Daejeonella lutea]
MKILLISLLFAFATPVVWNGNITTVLKQAKSSDKNVLINFSGSDWCGPCIRLKKEIFESEAFTDYASKNLLLVRADFPRQKKNKPAAEQIKLNEALAEKYNPAGKFPYTLLVDENGKVLKSWDGLPKATAPEFVKEISKFDSK